MLNEQDIRDNSFTLLKEFLTIDKATYNKKWEIILQRSDINRIKDIYIRLSFEMRLEELVNKELFEYWIPTTSTQFYILLNLIDSLAAPKEYRHGRMNFDTWLGEEMIRQGFDSLTYPGFKELKQQYIDTYGVRNSFIHFFNNLSSLHLLKNYRLVSVRKDEYDKLSSKERKQFLINRYDKLSVEEECKEVGLFYYSILRNTNVLYGKHLGFYLPDEMRNQISPDLIHEKDREIEITPNIFPDFYGTIKGNVRSHLLQLILYSLAQYIQEVE